MLATVIGSTVRAIASDLHLICTTDSGAFHLKFRACFLFGIKHHKSPKLTTIPRKIDKSYGVDERGLVVEDQDLVAGEVDCLKLSAPRRDIRGL